MIIVKTIKELRQYLQQYRDKKIGLVPTMGFLHDGHLSLVKKTKGQSDLIVMSIFVNPLQFGPNEDFERYPRDMERDALLAEENGVDVLFTPSVQEMYPKGTISTKVSVTGITESMCGSSRPGHFDGVATVVNKLFNIVQPDYAYFGQKDAQQVAVIKKMVSDLNIPVEIVSCPIIREPDGLAMSSRNVYLSDEERKQAAVLHQSLMEVQDQINNGNYNAKLLKEMISEKIRQQRLAKIDYVEIRSYPELQPLEQLKNKRFIIALAVRFNKTRLIDNVIINEK